MNKAYSQSTTTENTPLTDVQKTFDAQLTAASLLKEAIAKLEEATNTARSEKVSGFVKAVTPPAPAPPPAVATVTDLAKTACRDIKTAEEKAKENKDALECLGEHLGKQITQFERQNCADALAVYRKELEEFVQSDAQKCDIEKKIAQLEKCCADEKSATKSATK